MPRNLATIPEISIHAPRTGSDDVVPGIQLRDIHFNPRSPHGERPLVYPAVEVALNISIHAPRTGSDSTFPVAIFGIFLFQSTLPARGATFSPLQLASIS